MATIHNILPQTLFSKPSNSMKIKSTSNSSNQLGKPQVVAEKRCLRCNTLYLERENSPTACSFHGHTTGEKGLLALAPPHQGIDGEWSDRSGVIVYKWNEKNNRPNTGSANWKKRWSCCASMVRMPRLVAEDGMSRMMMVSLCISLCVRLLILKTGLQT